MLKVLNWHARTSNEFQLSTSTNCLYKTLSNKPFDFCCFSWITHESPEVFIIAICYFAQRALIYRNTTAHFPLFGTLNSEILNTAVLHGRPQFLLVSRLFGHRKAVQFLGKTRCEQLETVNGFQILSKEASFAFFAFLWSPKLILVDQHFDIGKAVVFLSEARCRL